MIELYILTGAAGAGKSTAQFVFEEQGFFVMDNVVPAAVKPTLEYLYSHQVDQHKYLFVVLPSFAEEVLEIVKDFAKDKDEIRVRLLTIKCDPKVLLQRFKLTRHVHPSTAIKKMSLTDAINEDNKAIDSLSGIADYRIDTSDLTVLNLRKILFNILTNKSKDTVSVCFMSFGHKHSIPMDVDLVLDTRALPNPYWDPKLRKYSGLDEPVIQYLEKLPVTEETFKHMVNYLDFYLDEVQKDGRGNYTIGVCCSGGRHRSVYFAERLAKYYSSKYSVVTYHRDIDKD